MTQSLAPVVPIRRDATPAAALARAAYDHGQTTADLGAFLSRHADLGLPVSPHLRASALAELAALQSSASPLEAAMSAAGVLAVLEALSP